MKKKWVVNFKALMWISGGYCEEVWSDNEYDFSKEFDDELSAMNFIENDEYYEDENHTYIICSSSKPKLIK